MLGRLGVVLALAGLFLLGDRLAAAAARQAVRASQFRFSALYRGGLQADVVIFGNSRAVHSFPAPVLSARTGLSVLNLGYNGMSFPIARALIEDYLARNARPRALVLELSTLAAGDDGLLADLRPYEGEPGALAALAAAERPRDAAAGDLVHLYRYNGELFLRALYYLRQDDQGWILHGTGLAPAAAERLAAVAPPLLYRPAQGEALGALVDVLEARGIRPVLVIAPYLPAYGARPETAAWRRALEAALAGRAGIIDDATLLDGLDGFQDVNHLNDRGAARFIDRLLADPRFRRGIGLAAPDP